MRQTFDLEDRLIDFAVGVCAECDRLPRTITGRQVASQLVRSATAPFANYGEARASESRRDFIHKMKLALKELRESLTWLKFIQRVGMADPSRMAALLQEANELVAIFVASVRTAKSRSDP